MSSETATIVKTKLCDFPPVLKHNSLTYKQRGVIRFHKRKSNLMNTSGHYNAYARRGTNH